MNLLKKFTNRVEELFVRRKEGKAAARLASSISLKSENSEPVIVVIAMPGCLHLTLCCISKLPSHRKVIVVANCCSMREVEILESFDVEVHQGADFNMPHAVVIDGLVNAGDEPFWLLDHDCFLSNNEFLTRVESQAKKTNALGATFFSENCDLGIDSVGFGTFLMYLNPKVIRHTQLAYDAGIGVVTWKNMSDRASQKLVSLGVEVGSYPQKWKGYFDTFRLIDALAHGDGSQFLRLGTLSFLFNLNDIAMHLGQTSRVMWHKDVSRKKYAAVGAYGSQVLFEKLANVCGDLNGGRLHELPRSAEMCSQLMNSNVLSNQELKYFDSLSNEFESWLKSHLKRQD